MILSTLTLGTYRTPGRRKLFDKRVSISGETSRLQMNIDWEVSQYSFFQCLLCGRYLLGL